MLIGAPMRAVGDGHHDRQAEPGGVVEGLGHVQQALAGGGGVGPRRPTADAPIATDIAANSDSTLMNSHGVSSPAATIADSALDDVRLRRDRIGADHLRPAQRDGLGDRARALDLLKHRRSPPCATARARSRPWRPRCCPRRPCLRSASRSRGSTESRLMTSVSAARPPSSAAFGRICPRCSRQMSPAGTVSRRSC